MDCECDSECNRFWAGRASLLTYIGRIAHRLPPLPVHPPLPVLPVQQLDKSSCAWKFHPSRRVESCKSCLESFIGYGKAATERGRQVKQGEGEERKWAGWRWNDCMWLEGKQCRLMGAFQLNWTELSCSEIECRQLNEQRRCQEIRSKKSNSEQKLCADPKKAAWILEKPINQAKSSQFNIVKVEQQLLKNC